MGYKVLLLLKPLRRCGVTSRAVQEDVLSGSEGRIYGVFQSISFSRLHLIKRLLSVTV